MVIPRSTRQADKNVADPDRYDHDHQNLDDLGYGRVDRKLRQRPQEHANDDQRDDNFDEWQREHGSPQTLGCKKRPLA